MRHPPKTKLTALRKRAYENLRNKLRFRSFKAANKRRFELIDRDVDCDDLSYAEKQELRSLQLLADLWVKYRTNDERGAWIRFAKSTLAKLKKR